MSGSGDPARVVIDANGIDTLIAILAKRGYEVLGPVRRDGAIVHEPIASTDDLPRGWIDEQRGGHYRLKQEGDAYFAYTVGPSSWKRVLHPPRQPLWRSEIRDGEVAIEAASVDTQRRALIGVRACELAAIAVQDRVFLEGPYQDRHYAARRAGLFIVAVNCGRAVETCFCVSMDTGPEARAGFDIALTEIANGRFVATAGSDDGAARLAELPTRPAEPSELDAAAAAIETAAGQMTRTLETEGLPDLLTSNPDHPRWDDVAQRCLNCANCTMVCPTCFCTDVEEVNDLDGGGAARVQQWASCFTTDFTYLHGGGAVRDSVRSRYRQWMTHKLATWHDQFGTSGCVGCGRCIAWCPVGIDITEEAAAMRGARGGG
ncbi:4Fe-4S dicluster domain-containing protein [Tropicimonas marinistellae]|uniref:4Fe-4S dicluster domain-containing protein n=1 Tax=Tropicimonas marinistellae TaxID=1739787 RepID=UPI00082DB222|nr:4Fe-4S dicluster domain-containing protein [Tropicimonas marinistellae]